MQNKTGQKLLLLKETKEDYS